MRQALRRRLRSLALGELTATVIFAVALYTVQRRSAGWLVGPLTWLGYGTLALILLQGTLYWFLALRRVDTPRRSRGQRDAPERGALSVRAFYLANALLLALFPTVCAIRALRGEVDWGTGDPWLGSALYLFAVGEFVHYFVIKIVRSDRDRAARGRWQAARFRRELTRGA